MPLAEVATRLAYTDERALALRAVELIVDAVDGPAARGEPG